MTQGVEIRFTLNSRPVVAAVAPTLALLELVKQRAIHVVQDRVFDTIAIERRPEVHLDQLMLDDYETRETSV